MKMFLAVFYITFASLSYGFEPAKPQPFCVKTVVYKKKGKIAIEPAKPSTSTVQTIDCKKRDKIPNNENFLKNHILMLKKFHNSMDKTIQEVVNKTPTSHQIAKIMFDVSNLINNIDIISQSNHLDKVMDVINQSDYLDAVSNIYELLCESRNFLNIFSLSFIEETVKDLPVKNEFEKKIESDWYKGGLVTLTKCISMLERFVELENCREDIMSFFPLVEKNHKQISSVICKMLTAPSATFLNDVSELVDSIQDFNGLLHQIETNTCLINSKGITQAQEIVSLAKGLHTYFLDLVSKIKETLEEVKTSENMEYYNCKSDALIQDVIHDIFLCKYNKMFYKQINNDVSKLLTLIKSIEDVAE